MYKRWVNEIKLFFNNVSVLFVLAFGYVFLFSYIIFSLNSYFSKSTNQLLEPIIINETLMRGSYIHFAAIGVLSYLFFRIERISNIAEIVHNYIKQQQRIRVIFLSVFNFFVFSLLLVYVILLIRNPLLIGINKKYIRSLVLCLFFDYFIVGEFSVFISFTINRLNLLIESIRIVVFLIIHFLFGYPFWLLSEKTWLWASQNRFVCQFLNFISVLPDGFSYSTDFYGIYPLQPHRVLLILFWFLFLAFCLSLQEKKKSLIVVSLALAVLTAAVVAQPCKIISEGGRTPQIDYYNYNQDIIKDKSAGRDIVESDFLIEEYKIDLYAYNNSYFSVDMKFDHYLSGKKCFTLYKDFIITSVKDQCGKKLDFERDGHYVYIDTSNTESITIRYNNGYGPFYGDMSGIFYKSGVPYYPFAGKVPIYKNSSYHNAVYWNNNRVENAFFSVKVHTIGDVCCSLPKIGKNEFEGYGDSFFLIKGIYEEKMVNGIRVIYPSSVLGVTSSVYSDNELESIINYYLSLCNNSDDIDIIVVDWFGTANQRWLDIYDHHIYVSTLGTHVLEPNIQMEIEDYLVCEGIK